MTVHLFEAIYLSHIAVRSGSPGFLGEGLRDAVSAFESSEVCSTTSMVFFFDGEDVFFFGLFGPMVKSGWPGEVRLARIAKAFDSPLAGDSRSPSPSRELRLGKEGPLFKGEDGQTLTSPPTISCPGWLNSPSPHFSSRPDLSLTHPLSDGIHSVEWTVSRLV